MQTRNGEAALAIGGGILAVLWTALAAWPDTLAAIGNPTAKTGVLRTQAASDSIALRDADGHLTRLAKKPNRIVSVALVTDEMLLDLVAMERIAALSAFADDPQFSNVPDRAKSVTNRVRGDAEMIAAFQPDLVLATDFLAVEVVEQLRGCGIPVHRIRRHESLDDIVHDFATLAAAIGDRSGTEKVSSLRRRLARFAESGSATSKPLKLLLLNPGGYTAGEGTLWHDIVVRSGASNHAATMGIRGYGQISVEQVLADPPDHLVLATDAKKDAHAASGQDVSDAMPDWLQHDGVWQQAAIARSASFIALPPRHASTASHYAIDCAETLKAALSPLSQRR